MCGPRLECTTAVPEDLFTEDATAHAAQKMVRVRWLAGCLLIVAALAGLKWSGYRQSLPLLAIGVIVLAYNVLVHRALRSVLRQPARRARVICVVQIVADVIALTLLTYLVGGIATPVTVLWLGPVIFAGITLAWPVNYALATGTVVLFGLVAMLSGIAPWPYLGFTLASPGQDVSWWAIRGLAVGAFAVLAYFTMHLTSGADDQAHSTGAKVVEARDLARQILSCMPQGAIFVAPDGAVLLWNRAASRQFSKSSAEGAPAAPSQSELPEALCQYVERVKSAPEPLAPETLCVRVSADEGQGPRLFNARASGVFDDEGTHLGYVIVTEEIVEQLHLEQGPRERNRENIAASEALLNNRRDMAQHEKMVALGTMAAGIAHEIGNPLASLSAVVQLLERHSRSEESSRHLHTLTEQIERIAKVVRQMLTFARPATNEWVDADLDESILQTLRITKYSHRARHAEIQYDRDTELPKMRLMPQLFQQVLVNLLLNALDAVEGVQNPVVKVGVIVESDWVRVTVADNGVGMSEEQLRQAFEPFYTTKPPGKGTGLGLAVSYRLVERQQGRIKIESVLGKGTVVTVSFRVAEVAAETGSPTVSRRRHSSL